MKSRIRKYIHLKLHELSSPALKRLKTLKNSGLTCISETRIKRYMKKKNVIIKKCRRSISPYIWKESFYSVKDSVIYQRKESSQSLEGMVCVYHLLSYAKHSCLQESSVEGDCIC